MKERAIQLKHEGMTVTAIVEQLKIEGHNIGRSTVGDWTRDCPTSESLS